VILSRYMPVLPVAVHTDVTESPQAGAEPHPNLSPCHIVVGIKEPPLASLLTSPLPSPCTTTSLVPRTHLMFSHTAKGQPYNMPLLARFLAQDAALPRLIDFELITDGEGRRTVGFGWFAGGELFAFLHEGGVGFDDKWLQSRACLSLCRRWHIIISRSALRLRFSCVPP
jgi:hypothetical protein